jgi:hypothetical protein
MVIATFNLTLAYGTIAVFDPDLENPFNDVTDSYLAQGFSWRPGSVSFFKHEPCDEVALEVRVGEPQAPRPDAARAIRVPFTVPASGRVEIGAIPSGHVIELPAGNYALLYETGRLPAADAKEELWWGRCWCRLIFSEQIDPEPAILVADNEMQPSYPLLMNARPA